MAVDPLMPPAVAGVRPLSIADSLGVPEGSFLDPAQHLIPDQGARYLQDLFLDQTGYARQRNLLSSWATGPNTGSPFTPYNPGADVSLNGMVSTPAPDGTVRTFYFFAERTSLPLAAYFTASIYETGTLKASFSPFISWSPDYGWAIVSARAALSSGALIGLASVYSAQGASSTKRALAYWRGGAGNEAYSTGTITLQNSTTVNGSGTAWLSHATPGMFLFGASGRGGGRFLGVVKQVVSDTQIILESKQMYNSSGSAAAQSYVLYNTRGVAAKPWVMTGEITVASGTTTVNGGDTKFLDQGVAANWSLFRASDMTWIGDVSGTPASNTQLTLAAGATISMADEAYLLIPNGGIGATTTYNLESPPVGFLTAQWQGTQFFANHDAPGQYGGTPEVDVVHYANGPFPDAVDQSKTGTWLKIPSRKPNDPITGLGATDSALLIFRDSETHGLFGTPDPATWQVKSLHDDGCFSPMSIQPYQHGVVWAGRRGIYFYDGLQMQNLLDVKAAKFYSDAIGAQSNDHYRAWSMISKDHYFLHIRYAAQVDTTAKGGIQAKTQRLTWCINLKTGALTFMSNLPIRGSTTLDGVGTLFGFEKGTLTEDASYVPDGTGASYVCLADSLFTANSTNSGTDFQTGNGYGSPGPDFYIESKLYDNGAPELKKLWKEVLLWHKVKNGSLAVDVVTGLDKASSTVVTTPFTDTAGVYTNKRVKFLKRSTHMGFRLYPSSLNGVYHVEIGPWAIGSKSMRPGRV